MLRITLLSLVALTLNVAPTHAQASADGTFDHVILVSVDGLRSDALLPPHIDRLPAFGRLLGGSFTLNARTDPNSTVTLPNHTGMITGRLLEGSTGHNWSVNDFAGRTSIHENRQHYVSSIFDVAHEHDVATGLFVSKKKFLLYVASYGMTGEETSYRDEVRDGAIDAFFFPGDMESLLDGKIDQVTDAASSHIGQAERSLTVVHYGQTDLAGHAQGWDLTTGSHYLTAMELVDQQLSRLFDAIEASASLRGKTAIILTTDHGGGVPFRSHTEVGQWSNYIIPLLVWVGDTAPTADLYELNDGTRHEPGLSQRSWKMPTQPIRNADAGNLALDLLGLPAVPGSTVNAGQDLRIALPVPAVTGSAAPGGKSQAP